MKKISLFVVALLSLAMLAACQYRPNSADTEPSIEEVVETTESEVSTTESTEAVDDETVVYDGTIIKNTNHPNYNSYYEEVTGVDFKTDRYDVVKKLDNAYRREDGKHYFETWNIYNSSAPNCNVGVITIDGVPFKIGIEHYRESGLDLKSYIFSDDAVWDLDKVIVTSSEEDYQLMMDRVTFGVKYDLFDENWNLIHREN